MPSAAVLATFLVLASCAHEPAAPAPAAAAPLTVVLGAPREILAAGYADPLLSPDGARVALATEDHHALAVIELAAPEIAFTEVCRVGRCGWAPSWQGDRAIAYRTEGQSGTAVPSEAVALEGLGRVPVTVGERGVHAWVDEDDRAWLREGGRSRVISEEGVRVIHAELTGDRSHVVVWAIGEGVSVHRVADGRTVELGRGGHPRVDPSGRWLVMERTEDDGHDVTRSDLFVADLQDYVVAPLVVSGDRIERTPSLSRIVDGRGVLAYVAEGALIVRPIELRR